MRISVNPRSVMHPHPPSADETSGLRRIDVSIARLVLRGFSADQGAAIAAQLRSELARLLADPHTAAGFAQSRNLQTLRIAEPLGRASMSRGSVGVQAAASIINGLRT